MISISNSEHKRIISILRENTDIKLANISEQPFGDYCWLENDKLQGIERKSIMDFVGSVFSGRLVTQLRGCSDEYDKVYLLLEGVWDRNDDGKIVIYRKTYKGIYVPNVYSPSVTYEQVQGSIKTFLRYVDIVYSPNAEASAYIILNMSKGVKPDNLMTKVVRGKRLPVWTRDIRVVALINTVSRMPEKMAQDLIKKFGTIGAIAKATPKQLKEVRGVKDGTIRNIHKAFWE